MSVYSVGVERGILLGRLLNFDELHTQLVISKRNKSE